MRLGIVGMGLVFGVAAGVAAAETSRYEVTVPSADAGSVHVRATLHPKGGVLTMAAGMNPPP